MTTNVSQIHFIQEGTNARTIVHLGSSVRQSDRDFTLERPKLVPVQLRVSQVNIETYDAPILLELLNNSTDLLVVDGRSAEVVDGNQRAPLNHNDVISIGDVRYRCELLMGVHLPRPLLQTAWLTVSGPVEDHNEDAIGVYRANWGNLFVISDGVGGAESGELISDFAVNRILAAFHEAHHDHNDDNWLDVLADTYQDINREVRRFVRVSAAPAGCTLTTVILKGWDAYVAHVGDSRLYLWNGISLRKMTSDHVTLVTGKNGQTGVTQRTMLLKAIGKSDDIEPDCFMFRLQPDDRLLLCTDGVYNHLQEENIVDLIRSTGFNAFPERLIATAIEHFSDDNLSVVAVRLVANPQLRSERIPTPEPMPRVTYGFHPRLQKRLKATEEMHTRYSLSLRDRLFLLTVKARRRRNLRWWIALALVIVVVVLLSPLLFNGSLPGQANNAALPGGSVTGVPSVTLVNTPVRPLTRVPTVTLTPTSTLPSSQDAPTMTPPPSRKIAYRKADNGTNFSDAFL